MSFAVDAACVQECETGRGPAIPMLPLTCPLLALHSGHYICYVKAPNGIWHLCDDHRVAQVSQRNVEGQQAYILFYLRRNPRPGAARAPAVTAAPAAAVAQRASAAADSDSKSKVASAQLSGDAAKQQKAAAQRGERAAEAAQLAERARSHEGTGPSGKSAAGRAPVCSRIRGCVTAVIAVADYPLHDHGSLGPAAASAHLSAADLARLLHCMVFRSQCMRLGLLVQVQAAWPAAIPPLPATSSPPPQSRPPMQLQAQALWGSLPMGECTCCSLQLPSF